MTREKPALSGERRAEAHLAALVHASDDAIVSTDRDGTITSWNPGAERLSGFSAHEVLGRPVGIVIPPAGAGLEREMLARVLEVGVTERMETDWRRPDGTLIRVELALAPIRSGETITGTSITGRDVTARHRAQRRLEESEERMRLVVETAHDPFVAMDGDGRIIEWNRAAEATFGWRRNEVLGLPMTERIVPEQHRERHEAGRERFLATGESSVFGRPLELSALHRTGHEVPIELTVIPVRSGGRWAFNSFLRDLTQRDEAEATRGRLAALVRSFEDAIFSCDPDGSIASWNPGAERLYGYPAEEVVGRSIALLAAPSQLRAQWKALEQALSGAPVEPHETERRHRDGRLLEISVSLSPIRDDAGGVVGASVIQRDIGERRRAERAEAEAREQQLWRATRDELTGLPNRRALVERAAQVIEGHTEFTLGIIDVDRFHELNDALGRPGGDEVLRALAATLRGVLPQEAILARLDSDRFGVMLGSLSPGVAAATLESAVRGALAPGLELDELTLHAQASVGVAAFPEDATSAEAVLACAERALRSSKALRSGFERYDAARDEVEPDSLPMIAELRRALERNELVLHFQPQLDLKTGRVAGAEGLLRWEHPERGLLGPGAFLERVERAGLMRQVTLAALEQAVRACRRWLDDGLDLSVAVNLSALNLLDLEIAHDVARLLAVHGVPARYLKLELTEDTLMVDPDRAAGILAGLKAMGVELAVDDYGTGYSSLAYLQRLPMDELKIDRCFVRDMTSNRGDAAIVRSTIDLGRNLGLRVVAEGVEDADALDALTALGCDAAQGFHIGRPMPAEALRAAALAANAET